MHMTIARVQLLGSFELKCQMTFKITNKFDLYIYRKYE